MVAYCLQDVQPASAGSRRCMLFAIVLAIAAGPGLGALADVPSSGVSPEAVRDFFRRQNKTVLTFMGYSGAGYEDLDKMLEQARDVLADHDPHKTIVNIGATSSGIGAVYKTAKAMGFTTTGIVSVQAKKYEAAISPYVDTVFYVNDDTWGGFKENSHVLSPTSRAMVQCSDLIVCFGGGEVSRDEMIVAKRQGKKVRYFPADMNHQVAIEKARKKGLPVPTDFKGAAYGVFGSPD